MSNLKQSLTLPMLSIMGLAACGAEEVKTYDSLTQNVRDVFYIVELTPLTSGIVTQYEFDVGGSLSVVRFQPNTLVVDNYSNVLLEDDTAKALNETFKSAFSTSLFKAREDRPLESEQWRFVKCGLIDQCNVYAGASSLALKATKSVIEILSITYSSAGTRKSSQPAPAYIRCNPVSNEQLQKIKSRGYYQVNPLNAIQQISAIRTASENPFRFIPYRASSGDIDFFEKDQAFFADDKFSVSCTKFNAI